MPDAQRAEIAKLESLHADHPEGRIFTHLAEAYRKAGELERARQVLAEGIERHPDYSSAHVVLARVLADQGDSAEAEAEFRRVLQLDSHNLVALRSLGDIARAAGRTEEAMELYRRLLDIEPSDEDVRAAVLEMEEDPAGEEESPWATDAEETERTSAGEEEPWSIGGAPDQEEEEDLETVVSEPWSIGDDYDGPEPAAAEPAAAEDVAAEDVAAEDVAAEDVAAEDVAADDGGPGVPDIAYEGGAELGEEASQAADDDGFAAIPDVGEPGVLTETIAQVYARQGLYDRAAAVYRQLLEVRPGDAGLRTRMEEMTALAAARSEGLRTEPEPELESDYAVEPPEGLPGLEPEGGTGEAEPLPGLETTEPEALPHVAPLGGLETDEIDPETGLRTEEPTWQDWSEPSAAGPDEELSEHVPEYMADEPVADAEPVEPVEPEEAEAEAVESVWTGAEGASGAEESPYAWAEGDHPAEDPSEPIDAYLRSLLGWAGGGAGGSAAPTMGGEAPGRPDPDATETGAETAGAREEADRKDLPGEDLPGGADSEGESPPDDDDLDTFRSWLESLKR